MSWENVVTMRFSPSPAPAISIGITPARRGHPRIIFNFNKAMSHKLGLKALSRAELEVGRGEHDGFVRITFNKPGGNCRVVDGGGKAAGNQGCRISSAIWPDLKTDATRAKLDDDSIKWDAEKHVLMLAIPPQFFNVPKFPNDLKAVIDGV